jgi:hypothetical protein
MKGENMDAVLLETKEDKLAHYADRHDELKRFAQFDGFYLPDGGDDLMQPDADGHWLSAGLTNELMHGVQDVRILVTEGADKEQVVALLLKLAAWIQTDGYPLKIHEDFTPVATYYHL